MAKSPASAAVLGSAYIRSRLLQGEIFTKDSWDDRCIRNAGYDLRMADHLLITPAGTRYRASDRFPGTLFLAPGEVAFVSSMERVCMPWDLAANIGIKFSLARQGVLLMTGLLVDPGYGQPKGEVAGEERLHFLVANVGGNSVALKPRDPIAVIQFLPVLGDTDQDRVPAAQDIEREFFDPKAPPTKPLEVFDQVRTNERALRELAAEVEATKRATEYLVAFGVVVLASTVLAAFAGAILQSLGTAEVASALRNLWVGLPTDWPRAAVLIAGIFGVIWALKLLGKGLASGWGWLRRRRAR